MPAFTFEKISPPARASATSPTAASAKLSKPSSGRSSRTLINQMLDRLAVARLRRGQVDLPPTLPRKPPPD